MTELKKNFVEYYFETDLLGKKNFDFVNKKCKRNIADMPLNRNAKYGGFNIHSSMGKFRNFPKVTPMPGS